MGGVVFILGHRDRLRRRPLRADHPAGASSSARRPARPPPGVVLLGLFVFSALVGFIDDFLKVRKRNSLGLSKRRKLFGQMLVGRGLRRDRAVVPERPKPELETVADQTVSFVKDIPWLDITRYGALALFVFVVMAMSNAVNLTDGLDGLATGASVMVHRLVRADRLLAVPALGRRPAATPACTATRCATRWRSRSSPERRPAACFGFLWWNTSPARIFMGDTGCAGAGRPDRRPRVRHPDRAAAAHPRHPVHDHHDDLGHPDRLVPDSGKGGCSGWSPLQHHFELAGWSEVNIVIRFWIIAGLGVAAALGLFYADFLRVMELS